MITSNYNTLIQFDKRRVKCKSSSMFNQLELNKLITSISDNINFVSYAKSSCLLFEELNKRYDNVITKANKLFIEPLANGKYCLIPPGNYTYVKIVNTIKTIICENPDAKCSLDYILNALMAASKARFLYDNNSNYENQISNLKKQVQDCKSGVNKQLVTSYSGGITSNINIKFTRIVSEYICIYGMPAKGVGIDSFRYQEILDELISKGIDPFS